MAALAMNCATRRTVECPKGSRSSDSQREELSGRYEISGSSGFSAAGLVNQLRFVFPGRILSRGSPGFSA